MWTRESPSEVASLAKLWGGLGLLRLAPAVLATSDSYLLARAFNCNKGPDNESRLSCLGCLRSTRPPSRFIVPPPIAGIFILSWRPPTPKPSRTCWGQRSPGPLSRTLRPFDVCCVHLWALGLLHLRPDLRPSGRAGSAAWSLLFDPSHFLVCVGAVAQGGHLGVEVGTAAHENLRMCSNRPFRGLSEAQGLVMDDFFSLCVKDLRDTSAPVCIDRLNLAKQIYLHVRMIKTFGANRGPRSSVPRCAQGLRPAPGGLLRLPRLQLSG